jgi:hypothetical protein
MLVTSASIQEELVNIFLHSFALIYSLKWQIMLKSAKIFGGFSMIAGFNSHDEVKIAVKSNKTAKNLQCSVNLA